MSGRLWAGILVAAGCVAVLVVVGVGVATDVDRAEPPDRIEFEHRDYHRGDRSVIPADAVASGHAGDDGVIYKPAGEVGLSVVVWLADETGAWAYGLVGGP